MDPNASLHKSEFVSKDIIEPDIRNKKILKGDDIKNKSKSELSDIMKSRIQIHDMTTAATLQNSKMQFVQQYAYDKVSGLINKKTIMSGANKTYDEVRLLTGKHVEFAKIGGVHLTFNCDRGVTVDAHHFEAATFVKAMEEQGGVRTHYTIKLNKNAPYFGKPYLLEITPKDPQNPRPNFPLEVVELSIEYLPLNPTKEELQAHKLVLEDARKYFRLNSQVLIQDDASGKYYAVDNSSVYVIDQSTYCSGTCIYSGFKLKPAPENPHPIELDAFVFDRIPSRDGTKKKLDPDIIENLKSMDIESSLWSLKSTPDKTYLVRRRDLYKLELIANAHRAQFATYQQTTCPPLKKEIRGVALLTTNQSDIVEQHSNEILSLLLEGANVLIYNNPGKGLSKGAPSTENINTSIEACYHYLLNQEIPDHLILAKGQCFGAAPTAWLGHQHPRINLFLDQNPSNFQDVVSKEFNNYIKELKSSSKQQGGIIGSIVGTITHLLSDNRTIDKGLEYILGTYDVADDISYNRGHKLIHINLPTAETLHYPEPKQFGGDRLVPKHHPEIMLDALEIDDEIIRSKNATLIFNPGGKHVVDWWTSAESCEGVLHFLKNSMITKSLFSG